MTLDSGLRPDQQSESRAAAIARIVAVAPPLTADQLVRLRRIFSASALRREAA